MRLEFNQGVPDECVEWLWRNVGPGNLTPLNASSSIHGHAYDYVDNIEYDWFYERITKPINPHAFGDDPFEYVPTITVKDEKMAVLFTLRWS